MIKWIHHLLNPHCEECIEEELVKRACRSCEMLRLQLDQSNRERKELLQTILEFNKPVEQFKYVESTEIEPVIPKVIPWQVRRQMLEAEDREKARLLKKSEKDRLDAEKLEKELNINPEVTNG